MKGTKLFLVGFFAFISLLTVSNSLEARTHVSFGFGTSFIDRGYYAPPCYVEEVITYQPVIVESPCYYGAPCVTPTYVEVRRAPVYPVYRERIVTYPRSCFNFGFWR